jgi:glycosyltransferase involved in cell wall biosynthesis
MHSSSTVRTSLDIVIPTYNRAELLAKTLASIGRARIPAGIDLGIVVVDNNSTDATAQMVHAAMAEHGGRLRYLKEKRQGRSFALNAGIGASGAELIGMIDDDEQIDEDWICEIARNFADPSLDFLGGPCLPNWGGLACPKWLPRSHGGLIGWIVQADEDFTYGEGSHAYMVGGNAVVRRRVLDAIGRYHTSLGRTKNNVNGGEDLEIFGRLLAAKAKGRYSTRLIIYHHIPRERLERGFFRRRSFWDGVSIGFVSRARREPVPHIAGIPRHFIRTVGQGLLRSIVPVPRRQPRSERFAAELRFYELLGRAYGRYFYAVR